MEYQGKVLFCDLTTGELQREEIPETLIRKFLGGRGINVYYLYKMLAPDTDPLSPENPLIMGLGLLTGTKAPSSARFNITAKSPESLILGDSNIGGHWPAAIREAGFQFLIFTGRAEKPVYLHIENGRAELKDASHMWGLNVHDFLGLLERDFGKGAKAGFITRAGERRVRMAGIMGGKKAIAARGGLGAVMGSKNLKAVVATGRGGVDYYDEEATGKHRKEQNAYLLQAKVIGVLGKYGTPLLYRPSNILGAMRTKNSQLNAWDDTLVAEEIDKHVTKMASCFNCVVHCRARNSVDDGKGHKGGEGPEYSSIGTLGSNLGVSGTENVIRLSNLCNELGLDTSSAGSIIAWAIELFEKGIVTRELTCGRDLRFGDYDLIVDLLNDISERRGFGDILAESTQAWKAFGEESKDYLIASKGLTQTDPHDPRILKGFALGLAVSSRGMDHLRNRPTLEIFRLPKEVTTKLYGQEVDPDFTRYETREIPVAWSDDIYAVNDAVGSCRFVTHGFNSPRMFDYEHYVQMIRDVTGLEFTEEELREIGRRIIDLERFINMREGITRDDDTLPKKYFDEGLPLKEYKGHRIDREEFEKMKTRYYRLRGWSDEGVPPDSRKEEFEELLAAV
ncbi:MAG: aldehyde ferredoxin oxidoreductase family protein [Nitrospinota bacterium]